MRKAARERISRLLKSKLEAFYGRNTCVVKDGISKINWHHLDEDPSNTVFENIIPIDAGLNQAIQSRDDIEELDPQFLMVRSRHHLRASLYSRAYGCSRLGIFISRSRGHPDESLKLAATAVRSLRPIGRVDLAGDLVENAVLPLFSDSKSLRGLTYISCAELLDELALVHLEFGNPAKCRRLFRLASRYLSGDPVHGHAWTQVRAQVLRHVSFAMLEEGNVAGAMDSMEVADDFVAESDLSLVDPSSNLLWEARVGLKSKDRDLPDQAIRDFEKARGKEIFESFRPSLLRKDNVYRNVWMEAALLIVKAEVEFRKGRRDDAFDKIREIELLFADGIHPTTGSRLPVIEAFGVRSKNQSFLVPRVNTADLLKLEASCEKLLVLAEAHAVSIRPYT